MCLVSAWQVLGNAYPQIEHFKIKSQMTNTNSYPLYDVPYLVRSSNDYYMSACRRKIRERNQTIVDDYFVARSKGASWLEARKLVAEKYQLSYQKTDRIIRWFFEEAEKCRRYDFLEKFSPEKEHITD